MNDKDLQIEDILQDLENKKNKVDGKAKGNRTELVLCKLLTKHFGVDFNRSVGSGNRWGQVKSLSEQAKQVFSGDISVPDGFKFVIESKGGYEKEINLTNAMDGNGVAKLNEFIEQSSHDSVGCGRKPIIFWKRNRKPWLTMLREEDLKEVGLDKFLYRLHYREWVMVALDQLLEKTERGFWFKNENI